MKAGPNVGDLVLVTRRESVSAIGRVEAAVYEPGAVCGAWVGDEFHDLDPVAEGIWQTPPTEPGAIDLRSDRLVFRRPMGCV